jgi:hypothetical protein
VSLLDDVAERDGWRCWVCDEPVDPDMSVNDSRGPSVDSRTADRKAKVAERLAHRGCNTRKGAVKVVIAWPDRLHVVEPGRTPKRRRTGWWTGSPDWHQGCR